MTEEKYRLLGEVHRECSVCGKGAKCNNYLDTKRNVCFLICEDCERMEQPE